MSTPKTHVPPNNSQLPENNDDKLRYFLDEAGKALDSTVSAYDALSNKAFLLFSVEATFISALFLYLLFQFDPRSLLSWAAVVYALALTGSGVFCWLIVRVKHLAHSGKQPQSFPKTDLQKDLPSLFREALNRYQTGFNINKPVVDQCTLYLWRAMVLFLCGTAAAFFLVVIAAAQDRRPLLHDHGVIRTEDRFGGWRDRCFVGR